MKTTMRIVHKTLLVALMVLMTMGLACDSSDNGGGGATPAAKTYSIADLTGNWTLVESSKGNPAQVGVLGFNNRGQIILWYYSPG